MVITPVETRFIASPKIENHNYKINKPTKLYKFASTIIPNMKYKKKHITQLTLLVIITVLLLSCSTTRPSGMKRVKHKKCNCPTFTQTIKPNQPNTLYIKSEKA